MNKFGLGCQKEHKIYILNLSMNPRVNDILLGLSFRAAFFFNGKFFAQKIVKIQISKIIFKDF